MAPTESRNGTAKLRDSGPETVTLQSQLQVLKQVTPWSKHEQIHEKTHPKVEAAHRVKLALLERSSVASVRDTFRHLEGFEIVIIAFGEACQGWIRPQTISEEEHVLLADLLQAILGLLAAALQDHRGNQKFFRHHIQGGGWLVLRQQLCSVLFCKNATINSRLESLTERVFGCLLACAINDESMTSFFMWLKRSIDSLPISALNSKSSLMESASISAEKGSIGELAEKQDDLYAILERDIKPLTIVHIGPALALMFEVWKTFVDEIHSRDSSARIPMSFIIVPSILNHFTKLSTANLVALHGTSLLHSVLVFLLKSRKAQNFFMCEVHTLATTLLQLGVTHLDDAQLLYLNAHASPLISELLLASLKSSRSPSYIHFDLSLNGFASVELPHIGRGFPPTSTSAGYTIALWLQIIQFDPKSHTTIFGAFDASQTCFVLLYLEKDTHNLILQTSVSSSRPSVRFKSMSFKATRWYHLVITHRRPKATSSSRASLFVNGEFIEEVKSQYPTSTPVNNSNSYGLPSSLTDRRSDAIQAFIGTPQDLASHMGRGLISTQWRIASVFLFSDVLTDDLIAVYFELGPRYTGNYQDCLGSFQTYQASAALNLRNESLHPGKEERSDIVTAIRSKASSLLPESNVLLNISANIVLNVDDHNTFGETHLLKFISKAAGKNLRNVTRGGRNALAINGAVPSINEALLHPSGFAVLTGDPSVIVPHSLDDAAWRLGGCAGVGLALLEAAHESDEFVRSLRILFESVKENWRNSEAMERENGFGVLSNMLNAKLRHQSFSSVHGNGSVQIQITNEAQLSTSPVSLRVLVEVLKFVGYRVDKPEESVINNPLAYRILLVDMGCWRKTEPVVQKLYYEQFMVFGLHSKYYVFNMKRLARMRITKRWLDALKSETFTDSTFGYFYEAFTSILTGSLSADSMRALALYITYAIHKPKQRLSSTSQSKSLRLNTDSLARRKTLSSCSPRSTKHSNDSDTQIAHPKVALRILEFYADLLCKKNEYANMQKFARTVTNKWLLHLLADDEPGVVVIATKILARLLVVSGPSYVQKFVDKTGGIAIMQYRLRRWWNIPSLWTISFAILFGVDIASIDFSRTFNLFGLLDLFASTSNVTVAYPIILPAITAMLKEGLKTVTRDQSDPDSPLVEKSGESRGETPVSLVGSPAPAHSRQRSMTLAIGTSISKNVKSPADELTESASTLRTVIRFLTDIHTKSLAFRDFAASSLYVQELFFVLFPIVVSANPVSPETELHSRDSSLTFKGSDVIMRPLSTSSSRGAPIVRTSIVEPSGKLKPSKAPAPKRMSSYVLVTSHLSPQRPSGFSTTKLHPVLSPDRFKAALNLSSSIVEELLELTIAVFSDQIFSRKEFPGLGLFLKVPPGFQEHQAYFETFILRNTLSQFANAIKLNQKLLWEPRVLTNLGRFAAHLGEAVHEGWFINGAEDTLEFLANILEYLQLPTIASLKTIRLCSQIISDIKLTLIRTVLRRLSELDKVSSANETASFLNRLVYWQTVLITAWDSQENYLKLLCYLLYDSLTGVSNDVRMAAADLWRVLLVQKPEEITTILQQVAINSDSQMTNDFKKLLEFDNEAFLTWMDDHLDELKNVFSVLSKSWEAFVREENHRTEETAKARIYKRREKLRTWVSENSTKEEILRRHEAETDHWRSNIYAAEYLKWQRALQDQQDSQVFNTATWARMSREVHRPCGVLDSGNTSNTKWELDQTEGRNRMRMRLVPDKRAHLYDYQPKRKDSSGQAKHLRSSGDQIEGSVNDIPSLPNKVAMNSKLTDLHDNAAINEAAGLGCHSTITSEAIEEDFEIVDNPQDNNEDYEDKNRKVMRSLQRGDQVEHVHNVSRIVGLEAIEGLLILAKSHLYILDSLFQRSDGEVVNVWQAPQDERDPYLQMIAGREARDRSSRKRSDYETRHWRWDDVLSISKRQFLFREVALEIFFVDGRSYLLTTNTPILRNELYQKLVGRTSSISNRGYLTSAEDTWRIDAVRIPGDESQTLGSKFTSVFAQHSTNPATRKWVKSEISNFHYLMLINTMAGRTFNDLTQYPVFPWILADYTSDELDLTNPRTFRDLSKPMGCQNFERQADFRDRYRSFAEMGDENSPPFHYGTHYSSAMIVSSYLIRLQPFVHSYLLLQGGCFDHPDRLFYSIKKAWLSASCDNMTDVRELIPEFFYLPEFLVNQNGYDFGTRQGSGGTIGTVALPPWAKGDPKIFIMKHREALESEYVSQHLHQWIDLVFGHKQRGEASLEATNVFHHLSYQGAKDLDTINDPIEKLATIGIIHNFGQTPHQVFQRSHPSQEEDKYKVKRLDTSAESLTRLPFPLFETHERIDCLQFSARHDRLLASGPFQINIGPAYDKYMEWGFIDGSVRFYTTENQKLVGVFEHVHQGQLSYVRFVDSKTLVTAGSDCTISIWAVVTTASAVDLQPKTYLFGHRSTITMLAVSPSFSALLSASSDGHVLLWDLNRLELVRQITKGEPVECARINDVTGVIMLCRGSQISLWTLNGEQILVQDMNIDRDDLISSCAFYEGSGNEYLQRELVLTGHKKGVVNIWSIAVLNGTFMLKHVKRMHHLDHAGYNIGAKITSILPMAQKVYTGDDDGRVYEWDCIQRQ